MSEDPLYKATSPTLKNDELPRWKQVADHFYHTGFQAGLDARKPIQKSRFDSSTIRAAYKIAAAQLPAVIAFIASLFGADGEFIGYGAMLNVALTTWQVPRVIQGRIKAGGIIE